MSKLAKNMNRSRRSLLTSDPFGFGFDHFLDDFWRVGNGVLSYADSIKSEDGSIRIHLEVPGYDKEDLSISYDEDNGLLSIASIDKEDEAEETSSYRKKSFSYRYTLRGYDPETFKASCDKGILTIEASPFPLKEKVRTIEVK